MTDRQIQAIIDTLTSQRDVALNTVVKIQAEKAALQDSLEELQRRLDAIPQTEELSEATCS